MDLSDLRKQYTKGELLEKEAPQNPFDLFGHWFDEVQKAGIESEANALTLSTIDLMGSPKSRVVLLKEVREDGFVFFTNYNSEKGQSIAEHNKVCLSFFWPSVERQIIIQGIAQKLSDKNSDQYFCSRPRGSQLGAHVSHQSREIDDRSSLEDRLAQLEVEYKDKPIPRPSHWGGFVVSPVFFEFWQGRPNRLHDRLVYHKTGVKWSIKRLSP